MNRHARTVAEGFRRETSGPIFADRPGLSTAIAVNFAAHLQHSRRQRFATPSLAGHAVSTARLRPVAVWPAWLARADERGHHHALRDRPQLDGAGHHGIG